MCNVGREYLMNPQIADRDLTLEEIKKFLERDYDMLKNVVEITFTGGEPFMRDDFGEMLEIFHGFFPNASFWIVTNGTLTTRIEEVVSRIVKIHRKIGISISIDGREETHDKIRGIKGTYKKAVQTIKKMAILREKYPWLNITIGSVLLPLNIKDFPFIYKLSKDFNVDFTFQPLHLNPVFYKHPLNTQETLGKYLIGEEKLRKLKDFLEIYMQEIFSRYKLAAFPHLYYYDNMFRIVLGERCRTLNCFAGISAFHLGSNGDIYPCHILNKKMGNIREKSLKEIWRSEEAKNIRGEIAKRSCICWTVHEIYRSMEENFIHLLIFSIRHVLKNKLNLRT